LPNFDYTSSGAYFVTFNTHKRRHLFGHIFESRMILSHYGEVAHAQLVALESHFPRMRLDAFVVMPDHVHVIVWLLPDGMPAGPLPRLPGGGSVAHSLSAVVQNFKSVTSRKIRAEDPSIGVDIRANIPQRPVVADDAFEKIALPHHTNRRIFGANFA
jgi:putative transposase